MNMPRIVLALILSPISASLSTPAPAQGRDVKKLITQNPAMEWRCVGPHVGNRGCTVAVHPTDRSVFYHGHSSGGLWKTEDAGQYWLPITDRQINVGAIGAMAVSPTNPKIIYIGTGEPQLRDCVSWGDGAYKSTDGGKTWKHIGLKNTRHISRIRVHPKIRTSSLSRRSGIRLVRAGIGEFTAARDGGKTWKQVFFKHEKPASSIWSWTRRIRMFCTRRRFRSSAGRGGSKPAARTAGSSSRSTAVTPGPN